MAERFESSTDDPKGMLAKKANTAMSFESNIKKVKAVAAREAYDNKVELLLDSAKTVNNITPKLTYGLGPKQFVCDTFVKYLFRQIGDHSLDNLYGSQNMYLKYSKALKGTITATTKFSSSGKNPETGDLLFFLDNKGNCPHVGIVSEYSPKGIIIYDASLVGVGKRTVSPSELSGKYGYTSISYASPFTL